MKTDISHIKACRNAWLKHWPICPHCSAQKDFPDWCKQGQALFDEYRCAITANTNCEYLTAKETQGCDPTTTP